MKKVLRIFLIVLCISVLTVFISCGKTSEVVIDCIKQLYGVEYTENEQPIIMSYVDSKLSTYAKDYSIKKNTYFSTYYDMLDSNNKYKYFSVLGDKVVTNKTSDNPLARISISSTLSDLYDAIGEYRIYLPKYTDSEMTVILLDSYGNEICSYKDAPQNASIIDSVKKVSEEKNNYFFKVQLTFAEDTEKVFWIMVKDIDKYLLTSQPTIDEVKTSNEYKPVEVGESIGQSYEKMTAFGSAYKDYSYYTFVNDLNNKVYMVFNEDGSLRATTIINGKHNVISIVNTHILASEIIEVGSTDEHDFIESGKFYSNKYYVYDLLTGKNKSINFDYFIYDSERILTEVGTEYEHVDSIIAKCYKIDNGGLSSEPLALILDQNFQIINNLTDKVNTISKLEQIDDGLYIINGNNSKLSQIVNDEFSVIAELGIVVTNVNTRNKLVFGYIENNHKKYYGALDYKGKVVIQFIYENLNYDMINDYTYGTKYSDNNSIYLVNTKNQETKLLLVERNSEDEIIKRVDTQYITYGFYTVITDKTVVMSIDGKQMASIDSSNIVIDNTLIEQNETSVKMLFIFNKIKFIVITFQK